MEYKKIKTLGRGSYSDIVSVEVKTNVSAMKIFKDEQNFENGVPYHMIRETAILKNIRSPYVISLLDIDYKNFEYIVLPKYSCSLNNFLKNNVLTESQMRNMFSKICLGIYTLHCSGIIHRDIKPSNICISESLVHNLTDINRLKVVLIDAGLSRSINYNREYGGKTPRMCSYYYRPPEVICNYQNYSFEMDVWSAGCILGEICLGEILFKEKTEIALLNKQAKLVGVPEICPFNLPDFIPKYSGELKNYFYDETYELISGMLKFNPLKRLTIAACLNSSYFSFGTTYLETEFQYNKYLLDWRPNQYYGKSINHDITFKMRRIIVLWMNSICFEFKMEDSTFFLAVMIMDFFCIVNATYITKHNFQLVALGCLLIASKINSPHPFYMGDLLDDCKEGDQDTYTYLDLIKIEKLILKSSNFNLLFPTFSNYISLYSERKEELSLYLTVCILQPDYLKYNFAIITATCYKIIIGNNNFENYECSQDVQKWIKDYDENQDELIQFKFDKFLS